MTDFLVLKKNAGDGGAAADWMPVTIARGIDAEDPDEAKAIAIKQGYTGEGTYKALEWDDDVEAAVAPAEPEVTMVSKRAIAEAEAKAAAE